MFLYRIDPDNSGKLNLTDRYCIPSEYKLVDYFCRDFWINTCSVVAIASGLVTDTQDYYSS